MSPVEISILLHCYCIREPVPRADAPATIDTLREFLSRDFIIEDVVNNEVIYITTTRGAAMVLMLLEVPYPVKAWVDPRTNEVIEER